MNSPIRSYIKYFIIRLPDQIYDYKKNQIKFQDFGVMVANTGFEDNVF